MRKLGMLPTCGRGISRLDGAHFQQQNLVVAGLQEGPRHIHRVCRAQVWPVPALQRRTLLHSDSFPTVRLDTAEDHAAADAVGW